MNDLGEKRPARSRPAKVMTYRHGPITRITHWINLLCMTVLLLSGLQILSAYPSLHWGELGADFDPYIARIEATDGDGRPRGVLHLGDRTFATTGLLGASRQDGEWASRAFPSWMTLPSGLDLATGRRWHFFFAWLFVVNGALYLATAVALGHFKRDLLPSAAS